MYLVVKPALVPMTANVVIQPRKQEHREEIYLIGEVISVLFGLLFFSNEYLNAG